MRTLTAMLITLVLMASAAWPAAVRLPLRRSRSTVLTIAQLKKMFPVSGKPIQILKPAIPPKDIPIKTTIPSSIEAGNPAYKTGSGVALTPSAMIDPVTNSELYANYVTVVDGSAFTTDGAIRCILPRAASQYLIPFLGAGFRQLPQSQHLYLLTINANTLFTPGGLEGNLTVWLNTTPVGPAEIKVNGNIAAVIFSYNAGVTTGPNGPYDNSGTLWLQVFWTGNDPSLGSIIALDFHSIQLVQLD